MLGESFLRGVSLCVHAKAGRGFRAANEGFARPFKMARFIVVRQLHGNAERDELELSGLQGDGFCGTKIDPVTVRDLSHFFNAFVVILDLDIHTVLLL